MRLGSAEISIVSDGVFRVDGGTVFGVVPKTIWSELRQPDRKNRVELGLNCMLIRSGGKCVLADTGIGTKPDRNMRAIYGMRAGKLVENLALQGVRPEDVDLVILTHLHFDHAGGCTRYGRGGSDATPVFPKATHLVQRADWEEASATNERTRAAYNPHDFVPLEQSGQLELLDGDTEVLPGLWARRTGGHTAGHQYTLLESEGEGAACFGDVLPTRDHLPLNYLTSFDLYPQDSVAAKRHLLEEAEGKNWLLVFGHGVEHVAGRLTRNETGRLTLTPEEIG
ncbi:MAG: MBL fold metallo-hydrolase [Chloroflexota bacterium]|nr:MBL fold metallo-hydrolase [Chloroflexota bacterium]